MSTTVRKQKYQVSEALLRGLAGRSLLCVGGSKHGKIIELPKGFSGSRFEVLVQNPAGVGIYRDGQPMWGAGSRSEFYKAVYIETRGQPAILGEHILADASLQDRDIITKYLALGLPAADFGPERLKGPGVRRFDVSSTAIKAIVFFQPPAPVATAVVSRMAETITEIETTSGGIYQYRGASLDDVLDFLSASSKGRHYNNVWKPKFGATSVKVEV